MNTQAMIALVKDEVWPSNLLLLMLKTFVIGFACSLAALVWIKRRQVKQQNAQQINDKKDKNQIKNDSIRVAFLGNSMLYFNDCPRLVERMLQSNYQHVYQDSCLRGGASLQSLFKDGNGMRQTFATPPALREDGSHDIGAPCVRALLQSQTWDFVVMNDHTQAPARIKTRQETSEALRELYAPLMLHLEQHHATSPSPPIAILIQTPAYRYPNVKHSDDLGNFDSFTQKLTAGYQEYMETLEAAGVTSRIAPVGQAFRHVRNQDAELWSKLYWRDDFHYSPSGTWLQACVIYCTMTQSDPPVLQPEWWTCCRRMQPDNETPLPLPNAEEAEELRQVAIQVCKSVRAQSIVR
ncbi:hypothetical protein MPSEU_000049900 [Mayamaea pseudoterrestris]|nr:hypothetical protein MPSEU_000049900 [Mayamaea pseudoterrestris]